MILARQIATCGACGNLVDLAAQMAGEGLVVSTGAPGAPPRRVPRPPVPLPPGMGMTHGPRGLVLTRRWLRGKHFVMLAVLAPLTAALAWAWQTRGFSGWMAIAAFFLVAWNFILASMFVNSTTVTVSDREIDVRHGPLPSLLHTARRVPVADVKQLFAAPFGGLFEVGVEMRDGIRVPLVRPLASEEQALFVEQQIERRLGLVDVEVAGELGSALPAPTPAAVNPGAGGAIAVVPALGVGVMVVFVLFGALSTELEGTLRFSGKRVGELTFTPTRCNSGQLSGFFGVELRAEGAPGVVVRLVEDPVQGQLVAVQRAGQPPMVLKQADCDSMHLDVARVSTKVNGVWMVKGSASFACAELVGDVKFGGCR